MRKQRREAKPLVLVHGLKNQYRWSKSFLRSLSKHWDGPIYLIFTNPTAPKHTLKLKEKTIFSIGKNSCTAGTQSISVQTQRVAEKIQILQEHCGLRKHFNLICHSMRRLISSNYAYDYPVTLQIIVSSGTHHQGTPLIDRFSWLGWIAGGLPAFRDLKTASLTRFNKVYPPEFTPLHAGGEILTMRGITKGIIRKKWGSLGEELIGWYSMRLRDNIKKSDGLVPASAAVMEGTKHIADFPGDDHMALVRKPKVARELACCLQEQQQTTVES